MSKRPRLILPPSVRGERRKELEERLVELGGEFVEKYDKENRAYEQEKWKKQKISIIQKQNSISNPHQNVWYCQNQPRLCLNIS